jgi:2-haloacid dehalogenase
MPWSWSREEGTMRRVQLFDVNETLLDLTAMDPHFQRILGDAGVRRAWFNQMISSALVSTVTGAYRQFGALAMAALEMTAEQAGTQLADGDRRRSPPSCGGCPPIPRWLTPSCGCGTPGCGWPR